MRIQYFRQARTYTLRASFKALFQAIRGDMPYKLQVIGVAYESESDNNLDNEWYITRDNPDHLYSRRFVEKQYELEPLRNKFI